VKIRFAIMKSEVNSRWKAALHPITPMNRRRWRVKRFSALFLFGGDTTAGIREN